MTNPEPLAHAVREYVASIATYIAAVHSASPHLPLAEVLARPDVTGYMDAQLSDAQQMVLEALSAAWQLPPDVTYQHLLSDVYLAYGSTAHVRNLILKGPTPRSALAAYGRRVALRNGMTVAYALRYSAHVSAIRAAPAGWLKRWVAHPERPTCCHWCRSLHNVTIPVHDDFLPYLAGPADLSGHGRLTQPPKAYLGKLQAPQAHPYCACDLVIVAPGQGDVSSGEAREGLTALPFLASSQVRSMSAAKYRLLTEFLRAAAHELGAVLGRLARDWDRHDR